VLSDRETTLLMLPDLESDCAHFREEGLITDVVGELKPGKEATVYLARNGNRLIALKHYRPLSGKRFATSARYREGEHMKAREERAFSKRTRFGRRYAHTTWIAREFATMRRVHRGGAAVPEAISHHGSSALFEFIPDTPGSESPAPRMIDVDLQPEQANALHSQIMKGVITMMESHVVHGDLSPFNILLPADNSGERRRAVIIDFPQAIDPRRNRAAFELLERDIRIVTDHCRRANPDITDQNLAQLLWARFLEGKI
jgi:RIO kinase 1